MTKTEVLKRLNSSLEDNKKEITDLLSESFKDLTKAEKENKLLAYFAIIESTLGEYIRLNNDKTEISRQIRIVEAIDD